MAHISIFKIRNCFINWFKITPKRQMRQQREEYRKKRPHKDKYISKLTAILTFNWKITHPSFWAEATFHLLLLRTPNGNWQMRKTCRTRTPKEYNSNNSCSNSSSHNSCNNNNSSSNNSSNSNKWETTTAASALMPSAQAFQPVSRL